MRNSTRKPMRFTAWYRAAASTAISVGLVLGFGRSAATEEMAPSGNVLFVRGVFSVFSLGLDDMAKQMQGQGLDVHVTPPSLSYAAAGKICQKYAAGQARGPIVLIGHSMGADLLPSLARQFGSHGLWVELMVMIDSTNPSAAPANVKRCVNLYQSNFSPTWFRIFRGAPIGAESLQTQLVNVDIRRLPHRGQADRIDHFNIDESPWIHQMVFREIHYTVSAAAGCSLAVRQAADSNVPAPRPAQQDSEGVGRVRSGGSLSADRVMRPHPAIERRFATAPAANRIVPPVPAPSNAPVWQSPRISP